MFYFFLMTKTFKDFIRQPPSSPLFMLVTSTLMFIFLMYYPLFDFDTHLYEFITKLKPIFVSLSYMGIALSTFELMRNFFDKLSENSRNEEDE